MRQRRRWIRNALVPAGLLALLGCAILRARRAAARVEIEEQEPPLPRPVADVARSPRRARLLPVVACSAVFAAGAALSAGAGNELVALVDDPLASTAAVSTAAGAPPLPEGSAASEATAPEPVVDATVPETAPLVDPLASPAPEAAPDPPPIAEAYSGDVEPSPAAEQAVTPQAAEQAIAPPAEPELPAAASTPVQPASGDSQPGSGIAPVAAAPRPTPSPRGRPTVMTRTGDSFPSPAERGKRVASRGAGHRAVAAAGTTRSTREVGPVAALAEPSTAAFPLPAAAEYPPVEPAPSTPILSEKQFERLIGQAEESNVPWQLLLAIRQAQSSLVAPSEQALALATYYRAVGAIAVLGGLAAAAPDLADRVLDDPRVEIYAGGREDIAAARVDPRVLAVIEYLAEAHGQVTVSSIVSGHRLYSRPGVVSAHVFGRAVDIAAIGGIPVVGNQRPGGVVERAIREILLLPPELQPRQVISLFALGGPSFALPDHDDHIHVGY